jgi:ATP-dependent DNA ligase
LSEHIADADDAAGIVAKRRDSRYRSGRCRELIKLKNRALPAIERAMLIALSKRWRSSISPIEERDPL